MIAKLKRRQINVVIKTEVMKKHGELQLPTDLRLPILNISESEENILHIHQDDNESHKSSEKVDVINTSTPSNVTDAHEVLSEACVNAPARLWTSMSRIIKSVTNAVQEISNVTYNSRTPLKRSMPECDLLDGPCIKRYKLTEIKCRRPIRQSTIMEHLEENYENSKNENIAGEIKKIFVDKATQTDDELTGLKFVKIAP